MLAKLFIQYVLAAVLGVGVDEGVATVYGTPGDIHAGGNLACQVHRPVPQDELLCAHRWLPCGTEVVVINLERNSMSSCTVADRGPFGADPQTGRWKGLIDLTPYAARAVRLDGRDMVRLIYKLPEPGHKTYSVTRFLQPKIRKNGPAW
jgi:rare lipoprotein A (peptidoglycan hydrolase)